MKRLFAAALLALTSVAFSATLTPVQLLNPAGSTSGQVISSTGPTTAPAWSGISASSLAGIVAVAHGGTNSGSASGTALDNITGFAGTGFLTRTGAGTYAFQSTTNGITLGNLAQAAANTVLSNATGSTANVTAFSMPSCSGSTNALQWTSGTGFNCNGSVNASVLLGFNWAIPGIIGQTTPNAAGFTSLFATGAFTPSQTFGIVGTTTNNNANAGSVGEYLTAATAGTSLTTVTSANVASISLTAGDWDVMGTVTFVPAGSTVVTFASGGVNTVSATLPAGNTGGSFEAAGSTTAGVAIIQPTPTVRVSLSTTTTVFLVANCAFTTSTLTASGFIRARRVR